MRYVSVVLGPYNVSQWGQCLVTSVRQNIFCVLQKTESHRGLEWQKVEQIIKQFSLFAWTIPLKQAYTISLYLRLTRNIKEIEITNTFLHQYHKIGYYYNVIYEAMIDCFFYINNNEYYEFLYHSNEHI